MTVPLEPAALDWNPAAQRCAEDFGLAREDVEAIVARPTLTALDPSSTVRDWRTERRTSGDITVVVTYPPGRAPLIWGVYLNLPLDPVRGSAAAGGSSGTGPGSQIPRTLQALRKRIVAGGLRIIAGGHHDRVETPDGQFVASLPRTPSDQRTVPNVWATIRRKGYNI